MATCFGCIRRCFNAGGFNNAGAQVNRLPTVVLDMLHMGQDVVIVKNGQRICGSGAALANAPLVQNKSYFEVKLQQNGLWGLGVATQKTDLNRVPLGQDLDSCVLTSDATVLCNREVLHKLQPTIQEGDVIWTTEQSWTQSSRPSTTARLQASSRSWWSSPSSERSSLSPNSHCNCDAILFGKPPPVAPLPRGYARQSLVAPPKL
ncbi:unnamed protein product [Ixodes pacificus]